MYVRERVGHTAMSRLRFCESRAESNAIVDAIVTYYICMYVYIHTYSIHVYRPRRMAIENRPLRLTPE